MKVTVVARGFALQQQIMRLAPDNASNFQLKPGKSAVAVPKVSVTISCWRGNKALFNVTGAHLTVLGLAHFVRA
jgi:hypothetical protein